MKQDNYLSLFFIFLRLGMVAWGGPVAQISMIREECVARRKWIDDEKFKRVLAVYQALPGPEAHEICVYFGMIRAGHLGALLAGLGFMLPGFLLILLLGWGYVTYGPSVFLAFFVWVAPAVTAMIVRALHRLSGHSLTGVSHYICAGLALGLSLLGVNFIVVCVIAALFQTVWSLNRPKIALVMAALLAAGAYFLPLHLPLFAPSVDAKGSLLIEGLKGGLLSFGGAYTAIPFLQNSMVGQYDGITQAVFLDSLALGSMIPSPLIIFGTFLGYVTDGLNGAIAMTVGLFAPAFCFTLFGHHYLEKLINNKSLHSFLDGIAAAVVGLLCLSTVQIFLSVIIGWKTAVLFAAALALFYLIKSKWAAPMIILLTGLVGKYVLATLMI